LLCIVIGTSIVSKEAVTSKPPAGVLLQLKLQVVGSGKTEHCQIQKGPQGVKRGQYGLFLALVSARPQAAPRLAAA